MSAPTNVNPSSNEDEIADEDLIDPANVIEPPPEMKTIIEKTVSFVVKNGIEFESKVRDSQRSNRKFDFLNVGHAFHNYYKQKYQISKYPKAAALAERYELQKEALHSTQQQLLGLNNNKTTSAKSGKAKSHIISHKLTLSQRIKQQLALSKVAKSEYIMERKGYNKFVVPLPTKRNISSYEIDVIKLVAQFTAVHGKSFIRDLQRGEPENETFGFLSPMHPRFQYFQRLIDAYCSIIDEFDEYRDNKRHNRKRDRSGLNLDRDKLWNEVIGHAEWTNREREKEAKYLKDEENERRANALIDWQDFTVLDTVDFDGEEDGNQSHLVPPGHSIEEIDAILESTMDVEADINDVVLAHDEEEDMDISQSEDEDEEMDAKQGEKESIMIPIEMESEASELHRKQVAKAKMTVKMKSLPMPAPKGVIISSDLDIVPTAKMETEQDIELRLKLEKILTDSRNEQFENQQCPICNEYINIKHLSQHIRIELLDPKWKEQKESLKLKLSQTTLASNAQISENLIKFNKHQHTDNMNANDISQKKKKQKAVNKMAQRENEEAEKKKEIEEKQTTQTRVQQPPPPQPQHPPIARAMNANPMAPYMAAPPPPFVHHFAQHPHAQHPMHGMPPPPGMIPPPHHPMHHHPHPHAMHPHHPHAHPHGMMPPPPPPQHVRPPFMMPPPPAKKMKLNNTGQPNGLVEEQRFVQQNGGKQKAHKIRIIVPKDDNKKQFKFNGQTLTFTMQLNQTINELKQRINAVLTLPMNKQKLRCKANGIWVKDANSLAFYNINAESVLELATRTRGGKNSRK
eukprot:90824_1